MFRLMSQRKRHRQQTSRRSSRVARQDRKRLFLEALEPRIVLSGTLEAIELNSDASSSPKEFVQVGDIALFVATDATHGRELWKTDGTSAGTVLLKDIQSGSTRSIPTGLTAINGTVYFSADDGASGRELWASDGTATGTVMVKDLYAGSSSSYDSYSYAYTSTANSSDPQNLTDVNGTLFFTADDGVNGRELWTSDGTAAGTALVTDLNAGSTWNSSSYSYAADSSDPQNLTDVNGTLFFSADDGVNGRELWISDGTAIGTVLVQDLYAGSTTDSTSSSTTANSSDPQLLTDVDGTLFFVANDGAAGMELWKSDGTAAGTVLVKDIAAGSTGAFTDASSLIGIGDTLFFTADDGENGDELWKSDGTSAETVLLKDIEAGSDGSLSKYTAFTDVDGVLFFSANDGANGRELWKSDGTAGGTVMVKDIDPGDDSYYGTPNNSYPFYLKNVNGTVYFSAFSESAGRELWKSDGTAAGTEMVADAVSGSSGMYPNSLETVNGTLLMSGYSGDYRQLWMLPLEGEGTTGTGSARLTIFADGSQVVIPAQVGVQSDGSTAAAYTTDTSGTLALESAGAQTLGDFFDTWRTNAGLAGNDSSAVLSGTQLLDYVADATSAVQMFVNGRISTEFDDYVLQDGDEIVLVYGSNPVVSLNTNFGPIVIELFESETPGTVENFLNYVNDGDFDDSIFHRSVTDFVIQGGGYTTTSTTFSSTSQFTEVPADAAIANEPGISNVRGTVAMAKLSGDPDSATSQFFVNLSDDNTLLDSESYGAFTVFGQVLDMTTVDEIAALPIDTGNASPFAELPLSDTSQLAVVQSIAGLAELTGVKFWDENANGLRDSGESGLAGVTVFLDSDNDGTYDAGETAATTDADGRFLLLAEPGTHAVRALLSDDACATLPSSSSGYTVTTTIGSETQALDFGEAEADTTDTDITDTDTTDTDTTDTDNTDTDASDTETTGTTGATGDSTLSGYVYLDMDGDGLRGTAEIGVPGVLITLTGTDASEATVSRTALTQSNGTYAFADLPAGTYQLTESQPQALLDGDDSTSVDGAVTNDDQFTNIVLGDGEELSENNFGERGLRARFITIAWFLASTPPVDQMLRETVAWGEQLAGSTSLAEAILSESSEVPSDVNVTPVAAADSYTVAQDGLLTVTAASGVLANDSDADGDTLTATLAGQPSHGSVTLADDGSFTYMPVSGYSGTDTFTYQAEDGSALSNVATVTISVIAASENETPVAVGDAYSVDEDSFLTLAASAGVLANDSDPDGDALTAQVASVPARGTLTLNSDGSLTYTPDADFYGTDSFLYAASDGAAYSAETTVTIAVGAVNDAPVAVADTFRVAVDAMLAVDAENGVLANDTDADGDVLTATLISGPADGSLTLDTDGYFLYVPDSGFHGVDTFSYVAGDDQATSSAVTVTIKVNTLPVVPTDSYEVDEDTVLEVDAASGVLSNDVDLDADSLTVALVAATAHGTLNLNADGSFTYTPDADFHGTDSFTYVASDGWEDSLQASVTISVAPVNDAPAAVDDQYNVAADGVLTVDASLGVLANDTGADGDALTATLASEPAYGTLTFNADGSLTYVPGAGFVDGDSFTYTVSDGVATSAPATVVISIALADLVEVRLEVAATDGTAVSELTAGQEFVVNVYVEDLRDAPEGVFASYFDLLYDSSLVSVNGEIEYGSDFPNGHRADATTVGSVVDVGGFAGFTELGGGEYLLTSVPFVALASGVADFTADTTNASAGDDTLLFALDTSVPQAQIHFVDATVQIAPAGEGEAGDTSAWAVDLIFAEDCDWLCPAP